MKIAVIGASGHGRVIIDAIEKAGEHTVACLLDSGKEKGASVDGYHVFGAVEDYSKAVRELGIEGVVLGIGDNYTREKIYNSLSDEQGAPLYMPTVIHPSAVVGKNVTLESGVVLLAGAIVNCGAFLGRGSFINTNASLGHDSIMGSFSSLAPGAVVGGNSHIGHGTAISLGAKVVHSVHIGNHSVIGAGAVVLDNIEPNCVAYGLPARVQRKRFPSDPYLKKPGSIQAPAPLRSVR